MNSAHTKRSFHQRLLKSFLKLTIGLGVAFLMYVWTCQSDTSIKRANSHHRPPSMFPMRQIKESSSDEHRIARHFAADTLPGLMRRGLIKKYERHQSGNIVFVAGRLWKKRSRFFKESLLSEVLVYNKYHGYALETRIIDHQSQRVYARAVSADRKEFFD